MVNVCCSFVVGCVVVADDHGVGFCIKIGPQSVFVWVCVCVCLADKSSNHNYDGICAMLVRVFSRLKLNPLLHFPFYFHGYLDRIEPRVVRYLETIVVSHSLFFIPYYDQLICEHINVVHMWTHTHTNTENEAVRQIDYNAIDKAADLFI